MAGTIIGMSRIKQLLQLKKAGASNRQIAKDLKISRDKANEFVNRAECDPLGIDGLLKLDDPVLERRFHPGNPAYSDGRMDTFLRLLPDFVEQLSHKHVTRRLVWEDYKRMHPEGYGKSQFYYHLAQNLRAQKPPISALPHEPGRELYVDFAGDALCYVDIQTGELVKVQTFVSTMACTDYTFALCVASQKTEDFIYALGRALEFYGGVPRIVVPDNLKAAVIRADRYEPVLNRAMEDMGNHYGFVTIPCQPVRPTQKAKVENQVKIIYHRIYARLRNRQFFSLEELNAAVSEFLACHNHTRMQQRPYTREERFISIDKPALKPLRVERFEIKYRCELQVNHNSFIYMGRNKNYYSVPYRLICQKVKVVYTRTLVNIYSQKGEKVASHNRSYKTGEYVREESHLSSYYNDYVNLSPAKYIDRACRISPLFGEVISGIFSKSPTVPPETYYKSCDGLFSLSRTTEPELFELALRTAVEHRQYSYGFIRNLIESRCAGVSGFDEQLTLFPADHDNIRGKEYYQ